MTTFKTLAVAATEGQFGTPMTMSAAWAAVDPIIASAKAPAIKAFFSFIVSLSSFMSFLFLFDWGSLAGDGRVPPTRW